MSNNKEDEPTMIGLVYTGNWFELLTEWAKVIGEEKEKRKIIKNE